MNNNISPFVKWAGGKRQLIPEIEKRIPKEYNTYYEPFLGGGAVLFSLQPEKAIVNDINEALINTYKTVRDNPEELIIRTNELDKGLNNNPKEYYYKVREMFNVKLENNEFDLEMSALFIFLNRHCFNGIYRVNSKGLFNVPYNNTIHKSIVNQESIKETSKYLSKITIMCADYEESLKTATKGDFIFIDSPYAPLNPDSFESYTKEGFSIENHKRVSKLFKELTDRGCFCMATNHNTEFIRELYKDYNIETIQVKRMINSDASNRKGEEVIIRNY